MAEVSVIIPVHDPGQFFAPCLASVLAQTMTDFEVVVVDDGSAAEIRPTPGMEDPRVRLVRQANAGVAVARNVGVLHARAPLVAFLDQDDRWYPEKLALQRALHDVSPDAAFSHTGFEWVWPDRAVPAASPCGVTYAGLLSTRMVCMSSAMVPRDLLLSVGGFHPLLPAAEDLDLFLRLAMTGRPIPAVERVLVSYHYHDANASLDYRAGFGARRQVLRAHRDRARRLGDAELVAACGAGLRRGGEIYGAQAVDALRQDLAARRFAALPGRVADVERMIPGGTVAAAVTSLRRRCAR